MNVEPNCSEQHENVQKVKVSCKTCKIFVSIKICIELQACKLCQNINKVRRPCISTIYRIDWKMFRTTSFPEFNKQGHLLISTLAFILNKNDKVSGDVSKGTSICMTNASDFSVKQHCSTLSEWNYLDDTFMYRELFM